MKHRAKLPATATAIATALVMQGSSVLADTSIATFDNFGPNALYASWGTATITATPTNYIIANAQGYGSLWKQVGPPPMNAVGNTNLVLDVTLSASNPGAAASAFNVLIDLKDGQTPVNTQFSYRFHGLGPGHHILVGNLFSTNIPATDNGTTIAGYEIHTNAVNATTQTLDLSQLWHLNVELDPSTYANAGDLYTITLNDLTLTGAGGGGGPLANLCATVDAFDGTTMTLQAGWTSQVSTPTNLVITGQHYGYAYAAATSAVNTDSNKTVVLSLDLGGTNGAAGQLGPIVILQDNSGNQMRYTWYGQSPGTNQVLTKALSAGTLVAGTTFNFGNIPLFQVQLDPGGYSGVYNVTLSDLSITGCTNTSSTGTAVCAVLDSFQYDQLSGLYASWIGNQTSTPTNLQFTASGFGGGYRVVSPQVMTDSNKTLRVNLTLSAPTGSAPGGATGQLGPIVVLQDGDGTQLSYAWYGQSPGTNLVLTRLLSAGSVVSGQPGTIAGFDFSTISYFHIQLDPSGYTGSYTVAWNSLDITGCAEVPIVITSWTLDSVNLQLTLNWDSQPGATYAVQSATDLKGGFTDLTTDIPSAGATTSITVGLTDPNKSFFRIRKQ